MPDFSTDDDNDDDDDKNSVAASTPPRSSLSKPKRVKRLRSGSDPTSPVLRLSQERLSSQPNRSPHSKRLETKLAKRQLDSQLRSQACLGL